MTITGIPKGLKSRVSWRGIDRSKYIFKSGDFILSQRREFKPFISELVSTHVFDEFISRRMCSSADPDVEFFDKTIDARKNKSILKVSNKVDTAFLNSANAHRSLHKYTAIQPNQDDVPASQYSTIGSHEHLVYKYASWPDKFDTVLFGAPRPFPKDIAAEFKRTITLSGGRFFVVPRDPFEEYHQGDEY
ncbi:hypothetical protein ACHAWO_011865 [Cyclotella atomus]|uniref:dDENN domain-containing protein n=1 Tax=Cyclotella atomus TaxID=382360 RepID=A0ABD3PKP9_9STRA